MNRFLLGLLLLAGCKVFDPSLVDGLDGGRDAGPDVATGMDVGPDVPIVMPTGCDEGSRLPPPRSAVMGDGPEVIWGLRDASLNQDGDAWRDIGLNLDGLCSTNPAPRVECDPRRETAMPLIDGNQGIDNAFGGEVLPLVNLAFPGLEDTSDAARMFGLGALVLRVRGWNGEANDNRVDVTVGQSVFGVASDGTDTPPEIEVVDFEPRVPGTMDLAPTPVWDGQDWLWLREESFFRGDIEMPLVRDDNAYVSEGKLVVQLPDRVDINFSSEEQGVTVRLTDARIVATIDGERLSPVVIGGRWSVLDLLSTANTIGVCEGDTEYNLLVNQLDTVADVRSQSGTGGPGVPCDAISVGVTFEGYRVRLAGTEPAPPPPDGCAD